MRVRHYVSRTVTQRSRWFKCTYTVLLDRLGSVVARLAGVNLFTPPMNVSASAVARICSPVCGQGAILTFGLRVTAGLVAVVLPAALDAVRRQA